jgi:hypothetical protein
MSSPVSYDLQGQGGGVVIGGGDTYTGPKKIRWIQLLSDTEFSNLISSNIELVDLIEGFVIPAGIGIGGSFSTVGLTTGAVIAYFA